MRNIAVSSWIVGVGLSLAIAACGGAAPEPETPAGEGTAEAAPPSDAASEGSATSEPAAEGAAPATFDDQVALGQTLYGQHCSNCHGASGEGSAGAPKVVGLKDGALPLKPPATAKFRKSEFKTVADIATFVVASMPPKAPGSLSQEEYLAILAFDLKANGISLPEKLTLEKAGSLEVPR
jgi:S-disulfanyl-L-cysteine oxidoreductase SoxD